MGSLSLFSNLIIFLNQGGIYSRHLDNFRVQSTGIYGFLLFLSSYYLLSYLLFDTIYYFNNFSKRGQNSKLALVWAFICFLPCLNSSMSYLSFGILFISNIQLFKNMDLKKETTRLLFTLKIKFSFISSIFFALFLILGSIAGGFLNKSLKALLMLINQFNPTIFIGSIFVRISTYADSLYVLLTNCDPKCNYFNPLTGFLWRFSFFNSDSSYGEEILTPARLNFLNTFSDIVADQLKMSGSSSGPLAGLFLGEPFIVCFIFVIILMAYFILCSRIFMYNKKSSLLLFILYFLAYYYVLGDPLDYLLFFTPSLIFLVFISIYTCKSFDLIKQHDKNLN